MHKISSFSRVAEREYALSTSGVNLLYYDLPKDYYDEYHSYELPRLCTILQGAKSIKINNSEELSYQRDQFVLLPPETNVFMKMPEHTKALVYEFDDHMVGHVSQRVLEVLETDMTDMHAPKTFAIEAVENRIAALHTRMQEILLSEEARHEFLVDLTAQEMVFELLRKQTCQRLIAGNSNHPIQKAMRILNSPAGLQMTLSQVAEEVGLSLSNFSQKFKAMTDTSPKQYITQRRLQTSKTNLKKMNVTDAALESGYDNISHFIRLFKNEFGVTPKQYQTGLLN